MSRMPAIVALMLLCCLSLAQNDAPLPLEDTLARIESLTLRGRNDQARDLADRLVVDHPQSAEAWVQRGLLHWGERDFETAAANFDRALAIDPENINARCLRLRAPTEDADDETRAPVLREVADLCADAIAANPDDPGAYRQRASVLRFLGDDEGAETDLRRALELEPEDAGTWLSLASTLQSALRWDEAEQAYRRALELEPSAYYAASLLASLLGNMGRHDEAIAMADRALAINPDEFWPHHTKVYAYRGSGRIEEALVEADRIIEMAPDRPHGYTCRALLLGESGASDEEMLTALDAALARAEGEDEWSARWERGRLLARMERWEDALIDLQRATELYHGHNGIYSLLARAHYHLGDYVEAWQALRRAEELGVEYGWTPDEEFVERLRVAMPEPPTDGDGAGGE